MIFLLAALLWQSDSNTAFAQAKQQHKLVLVEYVPAPCPKCLDVEHLADKDPALKAALSSYVLLRVRSTSPAYAVFDADKHERLRIRETDGVLHAEDWHFSAQSFSEPIEGIAASAPAFVQAADLIDAKRDLEANVLLATTYHRLKMTEHARAAFAEVEKIAQRQGNAAMAQSAKVQSAYTYVTDGRAGPAAVPLRPGGAGGARRRAAEAAREDAGESRRRGADVAHARARLRGRDGQEAGRRRLPPRAVAQPLREPHVQGGRRRAQASGVVFAMTLHCRTLSTL